MVDLHLHTYYSDGTMSPEELVRYAKECGVETIAITDHDGMGGLSEAMDAGTRMGVHVIPGIELSTQDGEGVSMHMLGYCFNPGNEALQREVELIRRKRVERNEKLLAALREIGCKLSREDLQLRDGQDYIGKPTFALALVRKGYVSTPKEAFLEGRFMRSDQVRRIHREKISAKRAIELIREAGGTPVLAHPMKISNLIKKEGEDFYEKLDEQLEKLKQWGLGGMECYYSGHSYEQTARLVHMARNHKLIMTAGSDFHGLEFDKNITVGGFVIDENFDEKRILAEIHSKYCNIMI